MSEQLASLHKKGGKPTMELLNTPAALTTSTQTLNLSKPITKYTFLVLLIINTSSYVYDGHFPTTQLYPLFNIVTPDYIKANTVMGYATRGNEGSMTTVSYTMDYVSDTAISAKLSVSSNNRYFYVYGIK